MYIYKYVYIFIYSVYAVYDYYKPLFYKPMKLFSICIRTFRAIYLSMK